jgi:hypothetical protein
LLHLPFLNIGVKESFHRSGKTHVDKDMSKRKENGRAKVDAQFFRITGGMPAGLALLLTSSSSKTLCVPHLQ